MEIRELLHEFSYKGWFVFVY